MHLVVITHWKEDTGKLTQEIAQTLGITAYEVRQRMLCGSPTVLAGFADPRQALELVNKLNPLGLAVMTADAAEIRRRTGGVMARHFKLNESSLHIETGDNRKAEIPYQKIDVLVPATSSVTLSKTEVTTERKLSLGKTLLMGGIPIHKKVVRQQEVRSEDSEKVLYLYVVKRYAPIIFSQNGITYEGLGPAMELSGGLNFTHLISELHRRSPGAAYDDRLLKRIGRIRLLGPTLDPDASVDIAIEILVRCLRLSKS